MVGTLVRLKVALLRGALRGAGASGAIGLAVAILLAVGFGGLAGALLSASRTIDVRDATDITAGVFGLLVIGWSLGPVITLASDNTLEADRLATFPLQPRQVMPGLLAASMVGIGGLFTLIVLVGGAIALGRTPASLVAIPLAVSLQLALCVSTSRAVGTLLSAAARTRRWRDVALTVGPLTLVALNLGFQLWNRHHLNRAGRYSRTGLSQLRSIARWFPGGWPGRAIGEAAAGNPAATAWLLLATAAIIVLMLWVWWLAIQRISTTSPVGSAVSAARASLLPPWLPMLPDNRMGAMVAKDLKYLWRDPRQRAANAGGVLGSMAALAGALSAHGGGPKIVLAAALPALFLGMTQTNQFGFDGAAYWTNVAAGDDVGSDLMGKAVAHLALGLVVVGALLIGLTVVAGTAADLLPAIGLAVLAWGVASAFAIVLSVTAPYPMPDRSSNVFSSGGPGSGVQNAGASLGAMFGAACIVAPFALVMVLIPARSTWMAAPTIAGAAGGVAAWRLGVGIARKRMAGRGADLLAALSPRRGG